MNETMPKYVFLDTDIGPDCDDTAALAILLYLCKQHGIHLLGITHCTGSPYGLPTIDAICRTFHEAPPLGTCQDAQFLSDKRYLRFTPAIAQQCPHAYGPEQRQPDASETLIQALSQAPDAQVTMICIGPLNNVGRFLREKETRELMLHKVSRIVCMGGSFEYQKGFAEWNIEMDIPAAQYVATQWPGALDFCPFEAGVEVLTGIGLTAFPEHPVSIAYKLYTEGTMLRPSWDLITVRSAVLGASPCYTWSDVGCVQIEDDGQTIFRPETYGKHRYLRLKGDAKEEAQKLEALLTEAMRITAT